MNRNPTEDRLEAAEREIADLLRPFASAELSTGSAARIRQRMLQGLADPAQPRLSPARRLLVGVGVVGPLLAVSAVAAATGSSTPLPNAVESAVSVIGIGGGSGSAGQEAETPFAQAGTSVQVASSAGQSGIAPGQAKKNQSTPSATATASASTTPAPGAATVAPESTKTPPHENGKGCDDVLFANGELPFASPGGPVGCEVGNSGEHRKNGAKASETPVAGGATATPTPAAGSDESEDDEDDDEQGGVSHGLGNGHNEDKPGNGNGNGHTVHEHDPNPNGNGPGGKEPAVTPSASGSQSPVAGPATTPEPTGKPNGGNGKAKGKN